MAQVLVRRFPFSFALAWVPGGPVGLVDAWGAPLRSAIVQASGARHLYCRVYPMREQTSHDMERMKFAGWFQPQASLNSGMSLAYAPSQHENARIAQASSSWRRNLRYSSKNGNVVTVWAEPDPEAILAVFEAMQSHKKLKRQFTRPQLISMFSALSKRWSVLRCDDAHGRLVALRGALRFGNKAWEIFAAATPEARKVYASHAVFWELMRQCALLGVQFYDMGGVDPVRSKGVYDFKKGTGASNLTYLGEWEWATSSILRRAANYAIKHRVRSM